MNKKQSMTISQEQSYMAPEVNLFCIGAEGVMCVSGQGSRLPDAEEDDWGEF